MPRDLDLDPWLLSAAIKRHVDRVIRERNGNLVAASRLLGVSRRKLYRIIEEHGITVTRQSQSASDRALIMGHPPLAELYKGLNLVATHLEQKTRKRRASA